MILDQYPLINSSLYTRQTYDHEFIRFKKLYVLLTTVKHIISRCKVYSIETVRTFSREGIEFGNFILIATIDL